VWVEIARISMNLSGEMKSPSKQSADVEANIVYFPNEEALLKAV
jgi:hypothetical protein